MRVNEEEISDVSDVSSLTLKQKNKNKKRSLKAILEDVSFCDSYESVQMHERPARSNLFRHVDDSKPIEIYNQFITREHRRLLASHINLRAVMKLRKKSGERSRPWHDIDEWEIDVFLGLILLMSLDHFSFIENYWNTHSSKSLFVAIQRVMTLVRFQQIKRFFKMSDLNNEPDFYDPDWWKKLEPLASDFQKISQELYMPGPHVSVDEQLILFKRRFKHILKMIAKEVDEGFKIYSLCERNYLLAFLFASKVSWTKDWAYEIVKNIDFWW